MEIKKTLLEGERGLNRYKNLIGIGVIFMFLIFILIFVVTSSQQHKLAEKCGFDDGKLKCVCTEGAWNKYQEDLKLDSIENQDSQIITKDLNTFTP